MVHFIQYHNPERYGSPHEDRDGGPFYVLTRKRARRLVGGRLWVVMGENKPRTYVLTQVFAVDCVGPVADTDFFYRIEGQQGLRFRPPLVLDDGYPWFLQMKHSLANFSLGLTEITHTWARYLVALAWQASPAYRQEAMQGWLPGPAEPRTPEEPGGAG